MKRLLAALLATAIAAQAAAPAKCRVRAVMLIPGTVPEELTVTTAPDSPAQTLHPKTFLNHEAESLASAGGEWVFGGKPAGVADSVRIGSCTVPAAAKSVVLVFVQEKPGKPECKVAVVDDSAAMFPAGSARVVNLTGVPVKIELEGKPFEFKADETGLIAKIPEGSNGTSGMKAFCKRKGRDEWEPFATGAWPNPGAKRVLQVLIDNPAANRLEILGLRDVSSPK